MLIKLHGRDLRALAPPRSPAPFLARVCTDLERAPGARATEVLLVEGDAGPGDLPAGFRAYLLRAARDPGVHSDVYVLSEAFAYLGAGDIVKIEPERGAIAALYRRSSPYNSMLVTERCDNYCVMCSQPPKARADEWLVDELLEMIPLMSPDTEELGITGGEPALLGEALFTVIDQLAEHLPQTAIHVLSNGRAFAEESFARALAEVAHPNLMIGIPLYGALPEEHDYVVQRRGAYDQTVRGILNLKRHGVDVELRFVIHAQTYAGLPEFARFVARNLAFVDHVALMGLELMGFARSNLGALWIDALDYQRELAEAAMILEHAGIAVSIYNHQLCVLDPSLHHLATQSISDWKNRYFDECEGCALRADCGGFFASHSLRRSRGIRSVTKELGTELVAIGE